MQTAVGVFGGEAYTNGINVPPLMVANTGKSGRPAISSLNSPPFVAVELCREHLVCHTSNRYCMGIFLHLYDMQVWKVIIAFVTSLFALDPITHKETSENIHKCIHPTLLSFSLELSSKKKISYWLSFEFMWVCFLLQGVHPCDKRQSITEYRPLFPAVDFSLASNLSLLVLYIRNKWLWQSFFLWLLIC